MKATFIHRLFVWLLVSALLFPIGVNFSHSFAKHNNFKCHAKSIKHFHEQRESCAIFHYIVNYNAPLVSNNFTFKICDVYYNPFIFEILSLNKINFQENTLRAPPIC